MKKRTLRFHCSRIFIVALAGFLIAAGPPAWSTADAAENAPLPFLSPMFGDNMMLQRGKPNSICGWIKPGQTVRVEIAGHTVTATAGPDGRWQAQIQPPAAGGPYTLKLVGASTIELHGVLVGDVWLCGGQSNMYLGLGQARDGTDEVKAADQPEMRLYLVQQHAAYSPAAVPQGSWKVCSPQTAGGFSAVAYFFGRKLHQELHVPIGLVEDCVGGTAVETWMSPETLHAFREFEAPLAEIQRLRLQGGPEYGNYIMHWYDQYDVGSKSNTWAASDFDDSKWQPVQLPGGFKELGVADVPSVCWFRKEFTLPSPLPAGKATLFLGQVEKMDTTYLNGHWVGASSWVENPRVYQPGEGVLKPGRNVLAVRVFKVKPQGGLLAKPEVLRLVLGDQTVLPLAGEWKGALSVDARPPHPMPLAFENYPIIPSVLFEGMLHPVAPLALTGAIWYQGEANAERAYQYRTLLPAMVGDWRKLFGQGDFPFYIVSLPAFTHRRD